MTTKIAILGSNGVIGKFLSNSLASYSVTTISRQQLDLSNLQQVINYFNDNFYDVVINCAFNIDSRIDAPLSVAGDNLSMFSNIYHVRHKFGRLIQFCSGAAFDRNHTINCAKENDIMLRHPCDPYGLSKNIISRICLTTDNFYTLRIFGVFYHNENKNRLLPKVLSGERLTIHDRYFDYFYLEDLIPVINYYIEDLNPKYKDINLVYPEKLLLSKFIRLFYEIHNINQSQVEIVGTNINEMHNYTGSSEKYCDLNLPYIGIKDGMKKYK